MKHNVGTLSMSAFGHIRQFTPRLLLSNTRLFTLSIFQTVANIIVFIAFAAIQVVRMGAIAYEHVQCLCATLRRVPHS